MGGSAGGDELLEMTVKTRQGIKRMRRLQKKEQGFTLLEIMIAVGIVGLITAVAVPSYVKFMNDAERAEPVAMLLEAWKAQEDVEMLRVSRYNFEAWPANYTSYFAQPDNLTPSLAYRPASTPRYNLIIGGTSCSGMPPSQDYDSLDDIGFNLPKPLNVNTFGGRLADGTGCAEDKFILGAERLEGDKVDLLLVTESGQVMLGCDKGRRVEATNNIVKAYSDQDLECDSSEGGGSGGGGGDSSGM